MVDLSGSSGQSGRTGPVTGSFITRGYTAGFVLVTSLFFLWAIANNFNDILIRQFQKALDLTRAQAGLIQFAFYLAYFLMALPAGFLMKRFGYRVGILAGLSLYACGALLFFPAAIVREYSVFLAALFVLASGAAFLETAANPYIVAFGDPGRASQRLNLAQAFNGFGGVLAPILGGLFIFSGVEHSHDTLKTMSAAEVLAFRVSEARMVQVPYLVLAAVVITLALAIAFVKLPKVSQSDHAGGDIATPGKTNLLGAVIAQFFYVGAQVGIWSFFVDFVKEMTPQFSEKQAAFMLSASLALFMIGRFIGTALMTRVSPTRMLFIYALFNIALCLAVIVSPGIIAVIALGLTSFFMSIMFPTIFATGIKGLGPRTSIGASYIIMAIIGGAIFPPAMGWLGQTTGHLQYAFVLPAVCFAVIAIYARKAGATSESTSPVSEAGQ
ncbi:L-fucose:H+ symporter permease [Asticcacaulis sp. 201]|uniref:L-fucose:H+ symporter permease n=1 Tax=Asticcacaulis sp. 201 TaxID=3028787 RepID=UPI0029164C9F|nr:L-fucose:H+ symporter permease [Asticcacaulis sp. 201]MDV6330981.1 L-fucose:H+ symporter permease [Asticcacaulis sp. 201]